MCTTALSHSAVLKRELTIGTPLPIIVASAYVATGKVDFVPDKEKLDI